MDRPGLFFAKLQAPGSLISTALAWVTGAYTALLGAMILVTPHLLAPTNALPSPLQTHFLQKRSGFGVRVRRSASSFRVRGSACAPPSAPQRACGTAATPWRA